RVVSNFIMQALRNEPITIYGDGSQTRSFCYVSDLIDGLVALMESGDDLTGPMNFGNPTEFTILQLAELVLNQTNSRSQLVFKELPEDDPKQRRPDIGFATRELGWTPKVPLEEGIVYTIDYFEKLLSTKSVTDRS